MHYFQKRLRDATVRHSYTEIIKVWTCYLIKKANFCSAATDNPPTTTSDHVADNTLHNNSLTCSEGFYVSESTGLCRPECGVWEELPHSLIVGADVAIILSAIVYLLSGTAVLVLSCIYRKRM